MSEDQKAPETKHALKSKTIYGALSLLAAVATALFGKDAEWLGELAKDETFVNGLVTLFASLGTVLSAWGRHAASSGVHWIPKFGAKEQSGFARIRTMVTVFVIGLVSLIIFGLGPVGCGHTYSAEKSRTEVRGVGFSGGQVKVFSDGDEVCVVNGDKHVNAMDIVSVCRACAPHVARGTDVCSCDWKKLCELKPELKECKR